VTWPMVSIHDVCRPKQWPTIASSKLMDSGFPVYGANGKIGFYDKYTHEIPTVLITCRGATCGTINICEPFSYVNGNAMALDELDAGVDLAFLAHYLKKAGLSNAISGSAQPQITREGLRAIQVPVPPLADQLRIAAILNKADALRSKRREALNLTDGIVHAEFIDAFGNPARNLGRWTEVTLEDVVEKVTDGEHLTPKRAMAGIKLLSARNVRDGYLDFSQVDYVDDTEYERISKRCNPEYGDILISCSGTIGRVTSVEVREPLSLVRSVALVKPNNSIIRGKFLELYLRTPHMKRNMLKSANASSQANLFQGQIRALPVLLPDLTLQDSFIRKSEVVARVKVAQQRSLAEFDSSFAALQHRAFRGEL